MRRIFAPSVCLGVATALLLTFSDAAAAEPAPVGMSGVYARTPGQVRKLYQVYAGHLQSLKALRRAAVEQEALDGGVLTPEHRAALQAKMDRSNDLFRRSLVNYDPLTVNAWGYQIETRGPAAK